LDIHIPLIFFILNLQIEFGNMDSLTAWWMWHH